MRRIPAGLAVSAILMVLLFAEGFVTGQTGIPVEDGGEFLTVARLGGINHPPGLPLLSLGARSAWGIFGHDGLRILFALLAAITLFLIACRERISSVLFALGVLLLPAVAGRMLMWDAYAPLLALFALALFRRPGMSLEGGYLTGIALCVHPQGIFLPVLFEWKDFSPLRFLGGLVLGSSLYLALPVQSAAGTVVDWGSTGDAAHFLRQISAGGYREVYGGSMGGISMDVLLRYLGSLRDIIWPVLMLPVILGAVRMYGRDRGLMIRLEVLLLLDMFFVLLVNPMAAGTTQTAVLSLLVLLVFAFRGLEWITGLREWAGLLTGAACLTAGVLLWQPLPDQMDDIHDFFSEAPLESGFFISNNDLLYGGWVMKYVEDRRPDVVLLSTGNFSGWFEDMAVYFNPDLDLSKGVSDVGNMSMTREQLSQLLVRATIEDNPHRTFFTDR